MSKTLYATTDELRGYAAERGVSLIHSTGREYTDEELQVFLTKAQDYLDIVFTYKGVAVNDSSEFPRSGLSEYDETTTPPAIRRATLYVACHIMDGLPILEGARSEAQVKREVVSANRIETEYAVDYTAGNTQGYVILDAPLYMLRRAGLLADMIGGMNMFGLRG